MAAMTSFLQISLLLSIILLHGPLDDRGRDIANGSVEDFPSSDVPWPRGGKPLAEMAVPTTGSAPILLPGQSGQRLSLAPIRVCVLQIG